MLKIFKVGGNLTKLWQKQICLFFETRCSMKVVVWGTYGLSWVWWLRLCWITLPDWANVWPQMSQVYGISPVCTRECT